MKVSTNISIIIPTYKRKKSTIRLLNSLMPLLTKKCEIIIVEQFENNNKEYIRKLNKLNVNYKYFFCEEASTPIAKNIGAKFATGEILLFLDDDVIVHPKLLEAHVANFENPKVGGVAGRVITPGQEIEEGNRNVGRITLLSTFTDGYSSTVKQNVDTVIGCNASWRKNVFEKVGGFDESFTGNAMREESDISLRVKKAGYTIVFEPEAVVDHVRAKTGGNRKSEGRLHWYFHFFSNETYFYLKHRPKLLLPVMIGLRTEWALRCMFGFGREVSIHSFFTPIQGIIDGVKKYIIYENRG